MAFSPSEQSHHRPDGGATLLDARCWRTDSVEDLWCEMNTWLAPRDGASEDGQGVAREAPEDVLCLPYSPHALYPQHRLTWHPLNNARGPIQVELLNPSGGISQKNPPKSSPQTTLLCPHPWRQISRRR